MRNMYTCKPYQCSFPPSTTQEGGHLQGTVLVTWETQLTHQRMLSEHYDFWVAVFYKLIYTFLARHTCLHPQLWPLDSCLWQMFVVTQGGCSMYWQNMGWHVVDMRKQVTHLLIIHWMSLVNDLSFIVTLNVGVLQSDIIDGVMH